MAQNAPNQNQEENKFIFDIEEVEFGGTLKTELTTTMELANMINSIFKPVLSDYVGCIVLPNQFGQSLELSLFFKDKGAPGPEQLKSIINAVDSSTRGSSPMDRIRNMNVRNSNKVYSLTEETKKILGEFVHTRQGQGINWNSMVYEVAEQTYNGHQIYVKVAGLDIIRILKKVYGKKNDGAYSDYAISIVKPVGQFVGDNSNYLISILQLNSRKVEELCKKIGMLPAQGNISMVRA